MTITIVQINFKFNDARNGHNGSTKSLVEPTIQANGLLWQVWLKNQTEQDACALYIFESQEAAEAYMHSPAVTQLGQRPAVSDLRITVFDAVEGLLDVKNGSTGDNRPQQNLSVPFGRPMRSPTFYRYSV